MEKEYTIQRNVQTLKEYINTWLCLFGFHKWGKWKNTSRFYDSGFGLDFGWIARLGRECSFCGKIEEKRPFLESERTKLIKEANS